MKGKGREEGCEHPLSAYYIPAIELDICNFASRLFRERIFTYSSLLGSVNAVSVISPIMFKMYILSSFECEWEWLPVSEKVTRTSGAYGQEAHRGKARQVRGLRTHCVIWGVRKGRVSDAALGIFFFINI